MLKYKNKMKNSILIPVFSVMVLWAFPVKAQTPHAPYCPGIESTAQVLKCLKSHQRDAESQLNDVFTKREAALEGEDLNVLRALQAQWIAYRDAQCDWEAAQSGTDSLKQINKTSCIARLTDHRAQILETLEDDAQDPARQRQFGEFPRWINALASDYPQIYWDYGGRLEGDMDCDGTNEAIIGGLSLGQAQAGAAQADEAVSLLPVFPATYHVAISANPPTGRPTASLVAFDIGGEDLCTQPVQLSFEAGADDAQICDAALTLKSPGCEDRRIVLTKDGYGLYTEPDEKQAGLQDENGTTKN